MTRPLTSSERSVLRLIIEHTDVALREILLTQLEHAVVRGGPITMLELAVVGEMAPVHLDKDLLPVRAVHESDSGEPLGELLVWTTNGYLSHLEYGWLTDEPPDEIPPARSIHIVRGPGQRSDS
jgi:hypothetical protein